MPSPPCMHKPDATIILKNCTSFEKWFRKKKKKTFIKLVELVETNPLIYKDCPLFNIHASLFVRIVFQFSANISENIRNLKKKFPLLCRARLDESIDA